MISDLKQLDRQVCFNIPRWFTILNKLPFLEQLWCDVSKENMYDNVHICHASRKHVEVLLSCFLHCSLHIELVLSKLKQTTCAIKHVLWDLLGKNCLNSLFPTQTISTLLSFFPSGMHSLSPENPDNIPSQYRILHQNDKSLNIFHGKSVKKILFYFLALSMFFSGGINKYTLLILT